MTAESDPIRPAEGYAGDATPDTAHAWWQAGEAVLVDGDPDGNGRRGTRGRLAPARPALAAELSQIP